MPRVDYRTLPKDMHEIIDEERQVRHEKWHYEKLDDIENIIYSAQKLANADFRRDYHERTKYNSIIKELDRINEELDPHMPLPLAAKLYFYNNPL